MVQKTREVTLSEKERANLEKGFRSLYFKTGPAKP